MDFLSRYPLPTLEGPAIEPLFAVLCAVQETEERTTMGDSKDTVLRQLSDFCAAETRAAKAAKEREAKSQTDRVEQKEPVTPVGPPRARVQSTHVEEHAGVRRHGPQGPEERASPENTASGTKRRKLKRGPEGVTQTVSFRRGGESNAARIQREDGDYQ